METNETLQTAIGFGVATYETSSLLNWEKHTKFYWCKNYYGSMLVKTLQEASFLCEKHGENHITILCEAPAMHEIARELPVAIVQNVSSAIQWNSKIEQPYLVDLKESFFLKLDHLESNGSGCVGYFDAKENYKRLAIQEHYEKYHFVEGYAKLYLKLREANLLM